MLSLLLVFAQSGLINNVDAVYNKNLLIEDSLFTAADSMSEAQIQSWLNSNAGFLKNWKDDTHISYPDVQELRDHDNDPDTPMQLVTVAKTDRNGGQCFVHRATGKTAAQIIHEAATNWQARYTIWKDLSGNIISPSNWASTPSSQISSCRLEYARWPAYGLKTVSPKVLLVTLQKEQSLITKTGSYSTDPNAYKEPPCCGNNYALAWAMGYAVPDSGSRNHKFKGFYSQINWAAWQFRYNFERSGAVANSSCGDTSLNAAETGLCWDDNEGLTYGGPMIAGTRVRSTFASPASYTKYWKTSSGSWTQGTSSNYDIITENRATASLYYYTPHACSPPNTCGNRNFVSFYETWFGATTGPCGGLTNIDGAPTGKGLIVNKYSPNRGESLTYTKLNNTGTYCTEVHLMSADYRKWSANIVTSLPSVDPTDKMIVAGNVSGDARDELIYINKNSGTKVVTYVWDSDYRGWIYKNPTNLRNFSESTGQIVAGDMNGDGRDELMFIKYSGAGGRVEVHTWAPGFTSWASHALTSLSNFDPTKGQIITGDMNGDGRDELLYVKYNGDGNRVEIHTWDSTYHNWASHALTMLGTITPATGKLITGDMNGDGRDGMLYLKYSGDGGRVEVHTMDGSYHSWTGHALTLLNGGGF